MEQGTEATPQMDTQPTGTPAAPASTETTVETAAPAATTDNTDWQKRFTDTQSAFTRSQQELAETQKTIKDLQSQLETVTPYYEHNKKFFNPDTDQNQSVWERDDGIDGALAERDKTITELREEMKQTREMVAQTQLKDLADDFVNHQKRLYQEFGSEFGTEDDFAEVLKLMPQYDPNWQNSYLSNPKYETLKRSYHTMRGAAEYDTESPIKKALEVQRQQAFLKKQSNYLGAGQSIQFGPDENRPDQPYMTPVEPF